MCFLLSLSEHGIELINIVAYLLKARTVKTAETAIARQWFSSDHMANPTDRNATME
jgi:hypothetical protein